MTFHLGLGGGSVLERSRPSGASATAPPPPSVCWDEGETLQRELVCQNVCALSISPLSIRQFLMAVLRRDSRDEIDETLDITGGSIYTSDQAYGTHNQDGLDTWEEAVNAAVTNVNQKSVWHV
jgi:hypothetical protein